MTGQCSCHDDHLQHVYMSHDVARVGTQLGCDQSVCTCAMQKGFTNVLRGTRSIVLYCRWTTSLSESTCQFMLTNQNMDWCLLACRSNVAANQCITSMTHQLLVWLFQSWMHVQINHLQVYIVHTIMHLIVVLTLSTHFWCIIVFGAIYDESCTCSHQVTYNFKHMKQHWWNHSCMFSASLWFQPHEAKMRC